MDPPDSDAGDASVRSDPDSSAAADTEESPKPEARKRSTKKSVRPPPETGEKSEKNRKSVGSSASSGAESGEGEKISDKEEQQGEAEKKNVENETRKSVKPDRKSVKNPSETSEAPKVGEETDVTKNGGRKSVPPKPSISDAESTGKPSRRRTNVRMSSSDSDSLDESEASHIRELMKRKRSAKESSALRMAAQHHDLPMQLAYDELDELADKAERVRSAIETNMSMLTLEMKKSELRYLRSAFTALKLYTDRKHARRLDVKNSIDYYLRRTVQKAFQAWRFFFLREQKFKRLQGSAEKLLRRHLLERIWRAWTLLVKKRLREDERHRREKQLVKDLQVRQRECVGRRAVQAIRRRRLQWVFAAFKTGLEINRAIRMRHNSIFYVLTRNKVAKAFKFWKNLPRKRRRIMRLQMKNERKFLSRCFWHWEDETAFQKYCKRRMGRRRMTNAFGLWLKFLDQQIRYNLIVDRSTKRRLKRLFDDFRQGCLEMKWRERTCKRAEKKCNMIKMKHALQAWIYFMQMQAHKRMIRLEDYAAQLEKENQRTRSECDRLGRIVDSGEWDQKRVAELEQASQILSGERDALTKLVGRLERDRLLAMEQQNQQDLEIRHLKEQILGSNFMHRNKLLVRGASSFNSVVRAVKSEVLKKGVDPDVVYSIDGMSMDQVSVFPDGDLRVKPLNKFDKGKWGHRASTDSTKAFMEEPPFLATRGHSPRRSRDHTGVY